MTRQEFIDLLKVKGYTHKVSKSGVKLTHNGFVYLRSLTTLPEGIKFENHGSVYLGSLTALPEGIKFENHGYVSLHSLTTLPEGIKFENHGSVYLHSLTGLHTYQGKPRTSTHIDGCTMIMGATKSHSGYEVTSARYFGGGPISKMCKCYVARSDELTAHGESIKSALEDLEYKIADNSNKTEIAAQIKASGFVTLAQFRGLTGACRDGIRQHLAGHGIQLDGIDKMKLSDAIKAMSGTSYADMFARYVESP